MKPQLFLSKIHQKIYRNEYNISGERLRIDKGVYLEWWNKEINIGDQLAPIIYNWMLEKKKITTKHAKRIIHLMTVGSLIGMKDFDATIWGSGIHCFGTVSSVIKNKKLVKYDIRAVRGPITKEILRKAGYSCSCTCGDPGVLMPLIYTPNNSTKRYVFSIIKHLSNEENVEYANAHSISVKTADYKRFIDEIVASECIISSSLHGLILAEAYGIPSIFLNENMDNELLKYYDWYFSTNRKSVLIAASIKEAMNMTPMPLPDLTRMQNELIQSFPYDLYRK